MQVGSIRVRRLHPIEVFRTQNVDRVRRTVQAVFQWVASARAYRALGCTLCTVETLITHNSNSFRSNKHAAHSHEVGLTIDIYSMIVILYIYIYINGVDGQHVAKRTCLQQSPKKVHLLLGLSPMHAYTAQPTRHNPIPLASWVELRRVRRHAFGFSHANRRLSNELLSYSHVT
jgi:hypothetical protein